MKFRNNYYQITQSEEQIIRDVAEAQNETSVLAESVLAQLSKTGYVRFPEQLPIGAKNMINDDEKDKKERKENVKVYPNPSQGDVTVAFEEPRKVNAKLYDATGRIVRSFETTNTELRYTITELSHGIYNLRLVDEHGIAENKRIIIK